MGCVGSKEAFTGQDAKTEADYKATFDEEKTLGQGEFGVVKLVTKKPRTSGRGQMSIFTRESSY